jgi:signal transduction histidine kinase
MVIRDITDRVKLDESLQATLNALEQKVRSEQLMLSVISHEFRTPLSTIQGFSEMLRDETALPADKVREFAGDINEEAKRLTRLVNALLERSRLESGRIQLDLTEFDVGAAVEAVVRQMGTASERHQLKITTVRGGQMYADRDRVTQCVMNLVSNAIKYSPDGGVVDILVDGDDATACVSVRDDGIGISPADQVVIFEPYHRLTESVAEGTGLGLSITRQLVELHGGRISVDSALGKGSTFRMCLPRGGPPKVVVGASR